MTVMRNPFDAPGQWYKANLHTHTTASDGSATVQERIEQYRARGYSALAITDHDVVSDAAGLSTESFLVIDGTELSIKPFGDDRFMDLLCINVSSDHALPEDTDMNRVIAQMKAQGAECFIAHPFWSGNTIRELAPLEGYAGIEVFNSGCEVIGKGYSSVHWDELLNAGIRTCAIAVDDVHNYDGQFEQFRGWTMLKMPELSLPAVVEALRTGCYYSSCGPEILDFRITGGVTSLRCRAAREIHLVTDYVWGASFYADAADLLTELHALRGVEVSFQHADDGYLLSEVQADLGQECKHVRAEIVDAEGKRAWSNPLFFRE
ncbi:MAG: CehA/McbA family metallohydrolase [Planctomycetes bacterium]|nr:CehA/McbA family metallohydrolase [Planctomycetota bacterium]